VYLVSFGRQSRCHRGDGRLVGIVGEKKHDGGRRPRGRPPAV
jgi:hypothetical protein